MSARPSHGARFVLERVEETAGRCGYRGFVHLPDRDLLVTVELDLAAGAARARLDGTLLDAEHARSLEAACAAFVRTAARNAAGGPPRRIVRWRA